MRICVSENIEVLEGRVFEVYSNIYIYSKLELSFFSFVSFVFFFFFFFCTHCIGRLSLYEFSSVYWLLPFCHLSLCLCWQIPVPRFHLNSNFSFCFLLEVLRFSSLFFCVFLSFCLSFSFCCCYLISCLYGQLWSVGQGES